MTQRLLTSKTIIDDGKNRVMQVPYTRANIVALYRRCRKYRTLFNTELREDISAFASIFLDQHGEDIFDARGIVWAINDLDGMFYITNIQPDQATVHFALFKKELRSDFALGKKMLKFLFERFQFQRIAAEVPVYVQPWVFTYVREVGFTNEGRKRRSTRFDDKYFDTEMFSILKAEAP